MRLALAMMMVVVGAAWASQCRDQLAAGKTNDQYCDCGDDEPETSACAGGRFTCLGEPLEVFASRVGDSVCDCCDGSDEPASARCPNTCSAKQQALDLKLAQEQQVRLRGEDQFRLLAAEACKSDSAAQRSDAEQADDQARQDDRARELSEAEMDVEREVLALQDARVKALGLDALDARELAQVAVKLASQVEDGGQLLEQIVRDLSGDEDSAAWVADNAAVQGAKNRVQVLRDELGGGEGEERGAEDEPSEEDFGPARVWKSLKHQCFTLALGEYTYELCLFKEFKQNHVLLGRWEAWAEDGTVMRYEHGQYCHIGVDRSVRVKVQCGVENRLVDLQEPSTCEYEATFQSPAACVPAGVLDQCQV